MVSPEVAEYDLGPWGLIILPIPFTILATIAISLRAWVRISFARAFALDDYLLVGAYILYLGQSAATIAIGVVQYTQGITTTATVLEELSFAEIIAYDFGQILFKLSLAVLFMRLVIERWQKLVIVTSVTLFVVYSIGTLLVVIFQCGDPSSIDLQDGSKGCLSFDGVVGPVLYILATFNAVIDWIFALLPITVIRKLQMKPEDKRSVIFMILLACSCSAVSIVRIPFQKDLELTPNFYAKDKNSISYVSCVESGFGIIVASAATYRPLLRLSKARIRHFIALRRSARSDGSESGGVVEAEHGMANLGGGKARFGDDKDGFGGDDISRAFLVSEGPGSSLTGQGGLSYASWEVAKVPEHVGWKRDLIIPEITWDEGGVAAVPPLRKRSVALDGLDV